MLKDYLKGFNTDSLELFKNDLSQAVSPNDISKEYTIKNQEIVKQVYQLFDNKPLTVLIEPEYIDGDYLDDYSYYYSRCFDDYSRFCKRIHFFLADISPRDFQQAFFPDNDEELKETTFNSIEEYYAGFMVVRPIPGAIIGKTCLKIGLLYGEEEHSYFPALHEVEVNLWGRQLRFLSLPFQEQDEVVSACATSSLWSSLNATARSFNHPILSPYQITKRATSTLPTQSRAFPNKGLTLTHLSKAVSSVGIEPFQAMCNDLPLDKYLGKISGYLNMGIPVLIAGDVYDSYWNKRGGHVVTVVGAEYEKDYQFQAERRIDDNIVLAQESIKSLYVHDDQLGPFLEFECSFKSSREVIPKKSGITWGFRKNKKDDRNQVPTLNFTSPNGEHFVAQQLFFPLHPKIRLTYTQIYDAISKLEPELAILIDSSSDTIEAICWDISLFKASDYKTDILENSFLKHSEKIEILSKHLPKYVWVAEGLYSKTHDEVEFVFDATGIHHDINCVLTIPTEIMNAYEKVFYKVVEMKLAEGDHTRLDIKSKFPFLCNAFREQLATHYNL